MRYIISCPKPHTHFIELEFIIENNVQDILTVQLPAWRPGRYELQNFARNMQKWAAFDNHGKPLNFHKHTKDCWKIETQGSSTIHIKYNYYACQLDAGACYLDEKQVYINPVHCFLYLPDRMNEPCIVELNLPADYQIATGMEHVSQHVLAANDYHQLADSPLIAGNFLQHTSYEINDTVFHIWFQGICRPDWERLLEDFRAFSLEQVYMMESFPAKNYHFLIHILPNHFYHGVEHLNSTVLALGPGYKLMEDTFYIELLGLASHELFHTWNIKAIRPVEMMPYDYSKENYSRLGYVCEGVTSYYGDLFLLRSKVFSEAEYIKTFNQQLQKHFDNYGRFNLSVADSSFDTWLDGYVEGIPARKTSIYTEGCLVAFLADITIRKQTANVDSLDDVMRLLYLNYGNKNSGYSEADYQQAIETVAGISFKEFFDKYVNGVEDIEPLLTEALLHIGLKLVKSPSPLPYENRFGFKALQNGSAKITHVAPGSIADQAGLVKDDEIIAVNTIQLQNNLKDWTEFFKEETISLTINSQGFIKEKTLRPNENNYYHKYSVEMLEDASSQQKFAFLAWSKRRFD